MSWHAVATVTDVHLGGDPSAKAVLLALAYHANREGKAWPSVATLAKETELGSATVRRAIRRLTDSGHISVIHRPGTAITVTLTAITEYPQPRSFQAGESNTNCKEPGSSPRHAAERGDEQHHGSAAGPSRVEQIALCVYCDEFGWLWRGDVIRGRCSHRPVHGDKP
jgi:hypothetical protein